jgi:phosphohistidine phosphatase
MKRLLIVRHAKSDWNNASLIKDIDRPLNVRGVNDAYNMAERLMKKKILPEKMVASIGIRALHTAAIFCKQMNLDASCIEVKNELYHAGRRTILQTIHELDNHLNTVFIFSHNPGINDFANAFIDNFYENVPTTGILSFTLNSNKWEDFDAANIKLDFFDFPKNHSKI